MVAKKKIKRIALCMNLNDFYDHGIARGVVRYSREKPSWALYGYGWMFQPVNVIAKWRGDGIISRVKSTEDEARLLAKGLPIVDVAGAYTDNSFQQVNNNDFLTGKMAGEHFLSRGFSNFAFAGVGGTNWSDKRKKGFISILKPDKLSCFEKSLVWWERPGLFGRLKNFLQKLTKPCAIFACNDTAGVKITTACKAYHIQVPQEISVIGVDNEGVLCELSNPPLSSIPCDCERIGYEAAKALDKLIKGGKVQKEILIPPRPALIRRSSEIFNNPDPLVAEALNFIHANTGKSINVNDVINSFDISRRNLEQRFKEHTGRTLHESIILVRLEKAESLLRQTTIPIRIVASGSGFSTLQQFYRTFSQHHNQTPNEFRRRKCQ